jgi:hypothetical protein
MKKYIIILLALIVSTGGMFAQENTKLAQTGMKFLSVSNDAGISGLGDASTSLELNNSSAMFFNPAGMARQEQTATISVGQTQWIADINYLYGSAAFNLFDGKYGVFGFTFTSVDYGDIYETIFGGSTEGDSYIDIGTFSPTAISAGIGYAIALSDKFSVGGNIKYVEQDLGDHIYEVSNGQYKSKNYSADVMAFDFGVIYLTGFKSLKLGIGVRNFSEETEFIDESFQLPLTFKMGLSMNMFDLLANKPEDQDLLLSVDWGHPRDNKEQVNVGVQYTFMDLISLRAGYIAPTDEQGINAGIGLKHSVGGVNYGIDYAYTDFGIFDSIHRFTIKFGL